MTQSQARLRIGTRRGLIDVTAQVDEVVARSGIRQGLCTVFVPHTSASLVIQENADPDVRRDLEAFLDRLVPDGDTLFRHVVEGPDDMSAHVKTALTRTSEQIPVSAGALALGTWQALYLWEHRDGRRQRDLIVQIIGD